MALIKLILLVPILYFTVKHMLYFIFNFVGFLFFASLVVGLICF